ncbi:Asp/Glu/hydantoin racemase [Agromyces laixinhei]|uniref:maleate cis-trans isomerase family protein n=1 Tax=Agromyces laixinhei TaxID=2585717 RepID=UPI001E428ED2|nr:Asp/Glu/hydantoin racemase [Agromyces laixinhei]
MGSTMGRGDIPTGPPRRVPIGVVAPHDMALDAELWRWVPDEAALFFARTSYLPLAVSLEMVELLGDITGIRSATEQLKAIEPVAYAFACTSGSFVHGRAGERAAAAALSEAGGAPGITASGAILAALGHLRIRRVAVATPYDATITARLESFLVEAGVAVTGIRQLDLDSRMWTVPYARTADLIREANSDAAEAIVVSCTNLPTYDLITPLEHELGKPIISANQATMWAVLTQCGLAAVGPGQHLINPGGT